MQERLKGKSLAVKPKEKKTRETRKISKNLLTPKNKK
jgi:hypothetical protein